MVWDERHARHLTRKVDRELRPLEAKITQRPDPSGEFFLHREGLLAEKRAAYELRDPKRYEAALHAMVASARRHLAAQQKDDRLGSCKL